MCVRQDVELRNRQQVEALRAFEEKCRRLYDTRLHEYAEKTAQQLAKYEQELLQVPCQTRLSTSPSPSLSLSLCVVGGQRGRGGPAAVRESHAAAEAVLLALEDGLPAGDARQVPGPVLRHGGALHEVPSLPAQTWLSLLTVTVSPLNRISEVSALLQEVNDCKAALAEANRAVDAREKEMAKMQTMVIRIPS